MKEITYLKLAVWGRNNVRTRNQNQCSLYLSTARSWIFNHILSHRIEENCFNQLIEGDIVHNINSEPQVVDSSNFDVLQQQLDKKAVQLTAALAGDNALPTMGKAQELEKPILDSEPDLMKLICGNRMRHYCRSVALYAENMAWQVEGSDVVVSFSLPSGSFATSVLREVVKEIEIERVYSN